MENKYESYRNIANAYAFQMSKNNDQQKQIVCLESKLEDLEQYGRRTSLRFHNVPLTNDDLQNTDSIIVSIINNKMQVTPPLTVNDINRSHIIGQIQNGKCQIIARFRNWKVKNSVYMAKRNLYKNPDNIFVTEDLTKYRQQIVKELSNQKKAKKNQLILCIRWPNFRQSVG